MLSSKGLLTTMSSIKTTTDVNDMISPDLLSSLEAIKIGTVIILFILIASINLAMGCTMTFNDFKQQWQSPAGIVLSTVSQFVTYPLVGFIFNYLMNVQSSYAIGVILVVASPGSSPSSLFTYLVDGDICMSVCSTALSMIISLGMLPALMFIYGSSWTSETAVIPYTTIAIICAVLISQVLLGMVIRNWAPKIAAYIVTIGTTVGLVGYSSFALFYILMQTDIIHSPWSVYFMVLILPIAGFSIGYATGYIFKQQPHRCRTIALETVFKNIGIAMLVLVGTYAKSDWITCLVFPILYIGMTVIYGLVYMMVFRAIQKHAAKNEGYASLEAEDDFENPWLLVETDLSFRY
ncbi:ileal sodium/bile acid cotransporter-like [Antedon mediterranea]|uniref:ileal sodium/bile acid cotransporter-like n=1 Tax=Antedon mediterranea TaxID=105859 RepID=UPI003AF7A398